MILREAGCAPTQLLRQEKKGERNLIKNRLNRTNRQENQKPKHSVRNLEIAGITDNTPLTCFISSYPPKHMDTSVQSCFQSNDVIIPLEVSLQREDKQPVSNISPPGYKTQVSSHRTRPDLNTWLCFQPMSPLRTSGQCTQ